MTPFDFHTGFDIHEKKTGKGETVFEMNCPFCSEDEGRHLHFFESTQFGCYKCGAKGNNYEFIKLVYDKAIQDIGDLAKFRGLPERALADFRYNRINGTLILPTYKLGKMNNLYKVGEGFRLYGTPGLSPTMYNWDEHTEQEVWMLEGQWDRCAAKAIIGNNNPITPIGIPGSSSFKDSWTPAFRDKDVLLCFDNDEAGEKGLEKTIKIFEETATKPRSLKFIAWPESAPQGYDLRDFYKEHGRKSYTEIQKLIKQVVAPTAVRVSSVPTITEDTSCDSYDKALDNFEKAFHTTSDMRACLASVLASIYSIKIEGEQLWFKIIGPPGCGKTRIAKAVSASDFVVSKSTITGLHSGYVDNSEEDPGLIPQIAGRTMIVKDADALMRQANIEKIMSEFRDFYDKDVSIQYRTRRAYEYRDVKSTIIICGTQVLRRSDQSYLGERFLTLEMDVSAADQDAICRKAMHRDLEVAMGIIKDPETQIMAAMKGWINHLRERQLDSRVTPEFLEEILRFSTLTALMRTSVDRDYKQRLTSPAVAELPTRLIGQMIVYTLSLSAVLGKNTPDSSILNLVVKCLRDTINPRSNRYKICSAIAEEPGIDAFQLHDKLQIPKQTIVDELEDLRELDFIKITQKPSMTPGRRAHSFTLDSRIASPLKDMI